jgi:hypothetical protein
VVRDVFLACGRITRALIATSEVGRRWDDESALAQMTVGAVASHLARGVLTVPHYMDMAPPDPVRTPLTASEYFAQALTADLDDELNTGIRARSDEMARTGQDAVLDHLDAALDALAPRLASTPADARVAVFGGTPMLLDEYLVTRILELVVHLDDLAVSAGLETPPVDARAVDLVTHCFLGVARIRNGDLAVIRALARRERAPEHVFPVF